MGLESLGGEFRECAIELIEAATGEKPPSDFSTVMAENMIRELVMPTSVSREFTRKALSDMISMSKGDAKDLSAEQIDTIVQKYFDFYKP